MDKPKKVKKDNKVKSINKHKSNHGPASSLSFTSQDLFSTPTILLSPFSSLPSITSLNLSSNLFSYIPDEISQLCNIEVLNVADNYISFIPQWIAKHTRLRELYLGNNDLYSIEMNLADLRLNTLDLRDILSVVGVGSLPTTLTSLDLSHNRLCSLSLSYLPHLQSLRINHNQLTELDNLPSNLSLAHVGHNDVIALNYKILLQKGLELECEAAFVDRSLEHIITCWYTSARELDLSGYALTSVSSLIGLCTRVEELDLSCNCLVTLPQELSALINLTKLDVSYNRITTLPLYLQQFTRLSVLNLEGTLEYLQTPPKNVASEGISAIMNYFNDLFMGEPSWRIKLMIVGQGRVGKTSILKCLRTGKKLTKNDFPSTAQHTDVSSSLDPLDIKEIKFFLESEKQNVTLSCWDFPGQEMYYAIHQMFFTRGSVYMVVWNLCQPEEAQKVEFWLNTIRSRADDLAIILVGTHMDKFLEFRKEEELNSILRRVYKKYYHRFSLAGVVAMSCRTQQGIDGLFELLQRSINEVPELRTPYSSTHRNLEKLASKLRAAARPPIMTWQDYTHVVNSKLKFHDSIHLKMATMSLVNLGFILYFDDPTNDLDQWVILDPQWLIDIFSTILTTKYKFIKDGILREKDLQQLWQTPDSFGHNSYHTLLVTLLSRFEILFLLPPLSPASPTSNNANYPRIPSSTSSSPSSPPTPNIQRPSSPSSSLSLPSATFHTPPSPSDPSNQPLTKVFYKPSEGSWASGSRSVLKYVEGRRRSEGKEAREKRRERTERRETGARSDGGKKAKSTATRLGVSPPRTPIPSNRGGISKKQNKEDVSQKYNQLKRNSSMLEFSRPVGSDESSSPKEKLDVRNRNISSDNILALANETKKSSGKDVQEKCYLVPSQLSEARPQFDLLWLPVDPAQYEFGRNFKVPMVPTGFFGHLMIRLLSTHLITLQPLLYWRYGFILTAASARAGALVELIHATSSIQITVRGGMLLVAAHLLRLINETLRVLLSDWYKIGAAEFVPCPHCVTRGVARPTLFPLEWLETAAAKGNWFAECGSAKLSLEKFVPDVALLDFWGAAIPQRIAYEDVSFHLRPERRKVTITPALQGGEPAIVTLDDEDQWLIPDVVNSAVSLERGGIYSDEQDVSEGPESKVEVTFSLKVGKLMVSGFIWIGHPPVQAEFQLPQIIGRGGQGRIMRGEWAGNPIAIKHLEGDDPSIFYEFRHELWIMGGLNHPNILQLYAYTVAPHGMVIEYAQHGDLYTYLHGAQGGAITGNWRLLLKIAFDIANGVLFLHSISPPILHRDIKTPNIMLVSMQEDAQVCAKLGDFGLASRLFLNSLQYKLRDFPVDNATWLAPEILREEETTLKSDVYAFGIILYELLTGKHPFAEYNFSMGLQLEDAIKNGVRPTLPASLSNSPFGKEYGALVKECWDSEPSFRPTFEQILTRLDHILAAAQGTQRGASHALTSPDEIARSYTFASFYLTPSSFSTPVAPFRSASPFASTTSSSPETTEDGRDVDPRSDAQPVRRDADLRVGAREFVGALQMTIQIPAVEAFVCLVVEGKHVWAGTSAGSIHIWNAENGKRIAHVVGAHTGSVRSMVFAGDLVWSVGDDNALNLWSPFVCIRKFGKAWKKKWFVLDPLRKELVYYARSDEQHTRVTGTIPILNVIVRNDRMERVKRSIHYVFTLSIPDSDRVIEVYHIGQASESEEDRNEWVNRINNVLEQNRPLRSWQLDGPSQCLAVVNNTVWAAISPKTICIWDHKDVVFLDKFFIDTRGIENAIIKSVLQHDNLVYVTIANSIVRINTETHLQVDILRGHTGQINDIISVQENLWTCSEDKTIRVWSHATGTCIQVISLVGGDRARSLILFDQQQLVWAGGSEAVLRIWRVKDYSCTATLAKHLRAPVCALALVFKRTVWSASEDNTIVVWS